MWRFNVAVVLLLAAAFLLFSRLNQYALWDDEAATALNAMAVWNTGDTGATVGHNVVAYRSGTLLTGDKERSTPPLGAYLTAPFVGIFGTDPWAARFPFALAGFASVVLILWWLYRVDADWMTWLIVGMLVIGNVSFWLYCRQCRYYGLAIFSSIAMAYVYLNWNGSRWQLVLLALASLMLLASNYLNYLAIQLCLLVDYIAVGRKRKLLKVTDWLIVLLPQIIIGGVIVAIWNTLGTGNKQYLVGNSLGQRLTLIWMNLRDINVCEFGAGLFLLASPILYLVTRRQHVWLLRAPLVLLGYIFIISMVSPQILPKGVAVSADVRYLAPVIPLYIGIEALVLIRIASFSKAAAGVVAMILATSNLLHGASLVGSPLRSTIAQYIGELVNPPAEPYSAAIQWIKSNVAPNQSVWVQPDHMVYPLMYHASHAVYAWQFEKDLPEVFKNLPPIHVKGRAFPDYIVVFAPGEQIRPGMTLTLGQHTYVNVDALPVFGRDLYRPELFWRTFKGVPCNVDRGEGIYVFKLGSPPRLTGG